MPELPLFATAFAKIGRAKAEMQRLEVSLGAYAKTGIDDVWSRTATIAFAVHGATQASRT